MMNQYEQGLVFNFEQLGCKGLAEKLTGVFTTGHVRDEDLLKVLTSTTEEEILRLKQERAEKLLSCAGLKNTYANLDMMNDMVLEKVTLLCSTGGLVQIFLTQSLENYVLLLSYSRGDM
jgi:hypothetical protein